MSLRRMAAVAQQTGLSCGQFAVLMILADCENDRTGLCNPSYETIGRRIGIGSRQVGSIIRSLVASGRITRRRTGSSNRFGFCFDKSGVLKEVSSRKTDVVWQGEHGVVAESGIEERSDEIGRKLPVSDRKKTSYKPGSNINQEYNKTNIHTKQETKERTCSCLLDSTKQTTARDARAESGRCVDEQGRECFASHVIAGKENGWACRDMTRDEMEDLDSWAVFHGLVRRYGVFRLNHRIVSSKISEIRRNGFRSSNGKPIRYMWLYLRDFATRIKDDAADVREYWRNRDIAERVSEEERDFTGACEG